jgi:hypothetical protein
VQTFRYEAAETEAVVAEAAEAFFGESGHQCSIIVVDDDVRRSLPMAVQARTPWAGLRRQIATLRIRRHLPMHLPASFTGVGMPVAVLRREDG